MRTGGSQDRGDVAARARAWRHAAHRAVCDVVEPWAHGTVVRATRCPSCFDYNLVRVETATDLSVADLAAFADEALAGLAHRRLDFEDVEAAGARRDEFVARGWTAMRLLWMVHSGGELRGPEIAVEAVSYEAVHALRARWMREHDLGDADDAGYHAQAREAALLRGEELLAVREAGELVAFAQLTRDGARAAEIGEVYVAPAFRGGGRGTALTCAAIRAAGDVDDLWIVADDEDRAKHLYTRLGFRPAWRTMEFTRVP